MTSSLSDALVGVLNDIPKERMLRSWDRVIARLNGADPKPVTQCDLCDTPRGDSQEACWEDGCCPKCQAESMERQKESERLAAERRRAEHVEALARGARLSPRHVRLYEAQREGMRGLVARVSAMLVDGKCAYVYGPFGCRKTTIVTGVALAIVQQLSSALFWDEESLFGALRDGSDSRAAERGLPTAASILRAATEADVLVWDDLGMAKRRSEAMADWTQHIVSARYNAMRSTVWTANVPPDQIAPLVGERAARRIIETSQVVELGEAGARFWAPPRDVDGAAQ